MKIPSPLPGLVLRYNYLWADDAARGREEGTKDRPAAIVMAVQRGGTDEFRVFALPVTHSPPQHGTHALEIPAAVLRAAWLMAFCRLASLRRFVTAGLLYTRPASPVAFRAMTNSGRALLPHLTA